MSVFTRTVREDMEKQQRKLILGKKGRKWTRYIMRWYDRELMLRALMEG